MNEPKKPEADTGEIKSVQEVKDHYANMTPEEYMAERQEDDHEDL